MAISFVGIGPNANGGGSITATPPTSSVGDILFLCIASKYPPNSPSTPAGWTLFAQTTGGTGPQGEDSGPVYNTIFTKISAADTGTTTVTISGGNSAHGRIVAYSKDPTKEWDYTFADGSFGTTGTTAWSITTTQNLEVTSGDHYVQASAVNTNAAAFSSENFTQAGVTFGTHTERGDAGTTTGGNTKMVISDASVSSGTANSQVTFTMTATTTFTNGPGGSTIIIRLREIDTVIPRRVFIF